MTTTSPRASDGMSAALAAVCVGLAIGFSRADFSPLGLALIAFSIAITAAVVGWDLGLAGVTASRWIIVAGIVGGLCFLNLGQLFRDDARAPELFRPFVALAAGATLLAGGVLLGSRKLAAACFWVLLAVHLMMQCIVIVARQPAIDVLVVQQHGAEALASGKNPYAMTFPDVYGAQSNYYPRGMVKDGQVQCGYCYMPLSLLLETPSWTMAGDVRYAHALAVAMSAVLLACARPGREGLAAAAMFLLMPEVFRRTQLAWVEPFVGLALCATVFFAARGRLVVAAIALGIFLSSKQYAPFAAPAALLLLPTPWRWRDGLKFGSIALAAGLAVTLPFVLWDPKAFFHSLTALYVGSVRFDAISFLPRLARAMNVTPSLAFAIAATLPATALVLWRGKRTVSGFAASCALILLCLFAFSPVAFGNYYSLAVTALCAAIATGERW